MKSYGYFTPQGEYIVTNPRTPEAWLHYLIRPGQPGTQTFCSGVSVCGGGFDLRGSHEHTLLDTRLHLNDRDNMGRYLYILDDDSRDLWSAQWQPLKTPHQEFQTTLGFGWMEFNSRFRDIQSRITMVVPQEFDGWVQDIRIRNTGTTPRHLQLYPFVPIHMGDALVRLLAGDNDSFFGGAHFDRELAGLVFHRNHGIPVADDPGEISGMLGQVGFFYSSLNREHTPYESDLERFYGGRFHDQRDPQAIIRGELSSTDTAYLRRACGVFQHRVSLQPGEEINFGLSLMLGSTREYYLGNKSDLKAQCALVNNPQDRKAMISAVRGWWRDFMDSLEVKTPHGEINRGFRWLQYQCQIVQALNRMKSRYHTGYEYGWGFRDILQDIQFNLAYDPGAVRRALLHIAGQMFPDGSCYHNFFLNKPGNRAVQACDDPLWFPQAVIAYCRETGKCSLLTEIADYAGGDSELQPGSDSELEPAPRASRGSILEHCLAALNRVWEDSSPRHLPYLKDCDWNDDLNLERINGRPNTTMESVMAGQQHYGILLDMAELLDFAGMHPETAREFRERSILVRQALETHGWDPKGYYKRALSADGNNPDLGGSDSREGSIFLESQIFAVLSGAADPERSRKALQAVEENLDTPYGAMLLWPVYTSLAEHALLPRRSWNIEKEPPAMKENGGIFMHLNAWLIQAYCLLGQGAKAGSHYRKIIPEVLAGNQDRYTAEPYVYPEYVRGATTTWYGRGGHTWLTGTATTMHQTLTQYILGIRSEYAGLRIDPCIDPRWPECTLTRTFRGHRLRIEISNPRGRSQGVDAMVVNGVTLEGNLLSQDFLDSLVSGTGGNPEKPIPVKVVLS